MALTILEVVVAVCLLAVTGAVCSAIVHIARQH